MRKIKKTQKILFVTHKANRSGAPLLFLEIIKEYKKHSTVPFQILIMEDGELTEDFKALGETYIWKKKKALSILYHLKGTSVVFFNTISNGHIHKKLLFLKCRFICYVHELEAAIHILTNKNTLNIVLKNTHLFLAGSKAVKDNLIINHNVSEKIIGVANYAMSEVYRDKNDYADFISSFKNEYAVPEDAVIIGVAASNEWRKGFDLFLPLVAIYFNLFPDSNTYFAWKGFRSDAPTAFSDLYDYNKFNKKERVLLLPHNDNNIATIACFNIHLLLSREDPYPLVVLEAASFGIPTVCFSDAGGAPEFIERDSGHCVPYGDLIEMATKLHELVENPYRRIKKGLRAQEKLKCRHSLENTMPVFIDILKIDSK